MLLMNWPPYDCEFNPIELIWAQTKNEVARKNITFKLPDVKQLFNDALQNVTVENWKKSIQHVQRKCGKQPI